MTVGFGLRLGRTGSMSQNTGGIQAWQAIDPSNTTAIFTGDPVVFNAGFIERAAATGPFEGVFAGCKYVDTNGDFVFKNYWDGNSGRSNIEAAILFAENTQFLIRVDDSQGNVEQAYLGTRRDVILNAGDPLYGDSRVTLGAVNASGPCYVVGRHEIPGNEYGQAGVIMEVSIAVPNRTA